MDGMGLLFTREVVGELPFTLNLPDGVYRLPTAAGDHPLQVMNHLWITPGPHGVAFGTEQQLATSLGAGWATAYRRPMRTVVRHTDEVASTLAELPQASPEQQMLNLKARLMEADPAFRGGADELTRLADQRLASFDEPTRQELLLDTRVRLAEAQAFGDRTDGFITALNQFIIRYMVHFEDRFVHTVLTAHFSESLLGGLRIRHWFNGQQLTSVRHAGGLFPYILRHPWYTHTPEQIESFRCAVEAGPPVNPTAVLGMRARGCLLRGEYRSAVVEASAALDLSITRQLRSGFRAAGMTEADIELELSRTVRFRERAVTLMRRARNQSVAALDNNLWQRALTSHQLRHAAAHDDHEPICQEAEEAVESFLALAERVEAMA